MMDARQWLLSTFPNDGERFQIAGADEFKAHGIVNMSMPVSPGYADIELFLEFFGDAINKALNEGTSLYDALKAVPDRGWGLHFELWKKQGIIS